MKSEPSMSAEPAMAARDRGHRWVDAARHGISDRLIRLPQYGKQSIMVGADAIVSVTTMWLAFSLRFSELFVPQTRQQVFVFVLGIVLFVPIFIRYGMYRAIFRYSGFGATAAITWAVTAYAALFSAFVLIFAFPLVPRTVAIIQPVLFAWGALAIRGLGGSLLVPDLVGSRARQDGKRLLMFGAGSSGIQTFAALRGSRQYHVVAFIDDDKSKQGRHIFGVPVVDRARAETLIREDRVDGVLLAMPTLQRSGRNNIIGWLQPYRLHVRSVPSVAELVTGRVALSDVRELDIEDLLGRDPVPGGFDRVRRIVEGRTIMVTGAGGSIGSELCRQLLSVGPARLVLVEASEFALYSIHRELSGIVAHASDTTELVPILCNVLNARRIDDVMARWRPEVVFHAAAYKHVPLVEHNVAEGLENNVFGTYTVARAAIVSGVRRFVLISTDKAVRPTNVMGATKRLSEIVLQAFNAETEIVFEAGASAIRNRTICSMVRFGNVLGSSGSVVPLFRSQIAAGGPVTVTHAEVTRYFMSIPEAAQLVLQASEMALGGEVFLLDMGEPVRIVDLARRMIALSGRTLCDAQNPKGDISLKMTGLRPGEKLYEELLIDANAIPTSHNRVMQAREPMSPWTEVRICLDNLRHAVDLNDVSRIRQLLSAYVAGFPTNGENVDLTDRRRGASGPSYVLPTEPELRGERAEA